MLAITFLNDGTGDECEGNYKWGVWINRTLLAKGELSCHKRATGWQGLVKRFSKMVNTKGRDKDVET
jgi:hypothetical protein